MADVLNKSFTQLLQSDKDVEALESALREDVNVERKYRERVLSLDDKDYWRFLDRLHQVNLHTYWLGLQMMLSLSSSGEFLGDRNIERTQYFLEMSDLVSQLYVRFCTFYSKPHSASLPGYARSDPESLVGSLDVILPLDVIDDDDEDEEDGRMLGKARRELRISYMSLAVAALALHDPRQPRGVFNSMRNYGISPYMPAACAMLISHFADLPGDMNEWFHLAKNAEYRSRILDIALTRCAKEPMIVLTIAIAMECAGDPSSQKLMQIAFSDKDEFHDLLAEWCVAACAPRSISTYIHGPLMEDDTSESIPGLMFNLLMRRFDVRGRKRMHYQIPTVDVCWGCYTETPSDNRSMTCSHPECSRLIQRFRMNRKSLMN
jgi:hypothetical protein